jgi:hypothetical protein
MKGKKILIFIFTIINNIFCLKLKCGNSKLKFKPPINIINKNQSSKRSLSEEFKPMKIKVDYTQLKIDTKENEEIFEIIKTSFELAVHYFELLLSVRKDNLSPYVIRNNYEEYCNLYDYDKNFSNWLYDYDLILFPSLNFKSNSDNIYAAAHPCSLYNFRPIMGRIYIENNFDYKKENIVIFLQTILFHEITHILVFEPNLLDSFGSLEYEEIDGEIKSYIKSPKVLEKARIHFGCDSLKGLYLEDQGDSGSAGTHWEGRYMLGDYMVSINYQENTISDITLALFEDSGWYKPNYYTGGLFRFGKDKGCQFFEKKCLVNEKASFSEFCHKEKEPKCTSSYLGTGECYIGEIKHEEIPKKYQYFKKSNLGGLLNVNFCPTADSFFESITQGKFYFENNCRYGAALLPYYGEEIGNRSICLESSLIPRYSPQPYKWRSICHKVICDRLNKNVIVFINDLNVTCPFKGGTLKKIKGFKGKINCPPYNMVCTSETWCNEMFECIDKKSVTDYNTYKNYPTKSNDEL